MKHFIPKIENAHWYIRILTGAILIVLGTVLSPANGQISYNADYYGNNGYMYFVLTAICLITGFTLCVSVFRNGVACIDYVGRNTMPIMLMHKFPIPLLRRCAWNDKETCQFFSAMWVDNCCNMFSWAELRCSGNYLSHPSMDVGKRRKA